MWHLRKPQIYLVSLGRVSFADVEYNIGLVVTLLGFIKGLGHSILGNFSTDQMVIEVTKI